MELIILHSNDTHGHLTPLPTGDSRSLGGYARRSTFIKQQRAAHPHTLLVDVGDFYQGSKYWHAFSGEPDIDLMNSLGYDVAALGNHDFDGGVPLLAERLKQTKFPVLCANLTVPADHMLAGLWQPSLIKTVGGVRIGIFSLLIDALALYPLEFRTEGQWSPIFETAHQLAAQLRAEVDLVVCLSHLGHYGDVALAESGPDIDLIIGGHSHAALDEILWVNQIPITRAIVGTQKIGRIQLQVESGQSPHLQDYRLIPLDEHFADDEAIATYLALWQEKLPPEIALGQLLTPIDTRIEAKGLGESAAGNLYVDAMQAYFDSDIDLSFVHVGTLRGDRLFGPGNFTNHDLGEFHPFPNNPTLMVLNAPQLKLLLERGVSQLPMAQSIFLAQAGLTISVDLSRLAMVIDEAQQAITLHGQRIVHASYQDQSIDFTDENCRFRVAVDGYIGHGGTGYFFLEAGSDIQHTNIAAADIITWYLKHYSPIEFKPQGRIIIQSTSS